MMKSRSDADGERSALYSPGGSSPSRREFLGLGSALLSLPIAANLPVASAAPLAEGSAARDGDAEIAAVLRRYGSEFGNITTVK